MQLPPRHKENLTLSPKQSPLCRSFSRQNYIPAADHALSLPDLQTCCLTAATGLSPLPADVEMPQAEPKRLVWLGKACIRCLGPRAGALPRSPYTLMHIPVSALHLCIMDALHPATVSQFAPQGLQGARSSGRDRSPVHLWECFPSHAGGKGCILS